MKRRVIKQGHNTLTLTLPAKWALKNNIKAGDEIDVAESDSSLIVNPSEVESQKKEITVDVRGLLPRLADRFVARSYQKGYDKITLNFDEEDVKFAVQQKVGELIGFEVMNVTNENIQVHSISSKMDIDFDQTLRKALILLMDMAETCLKAYQSDDKKALENVQLKDYDVNRFLYFCLRYLNTREQKMTFGMSILYYLIETLEDLGDELKALGQFLAQMNRKNPNLVRLLKKLNEMFRISYEFFYKPEKTKAVRAFLIYKEIKGQIDDMLPGKGKSEAKAIIAIDMSVRIIYHLTTMRLDTLKGLGG